MIRNFEITTSDDSVFHSSEEARCLVNLVASLPHVTRVVPVELSVTGGERCYTLSVQGKYTPDEIIRNLNERKYSARLK